MSGGSNQQYPPMGGGQGGGMPQYRSPGFESGGPDDPAMGGSGYMGGGWGGGMPPRRMPPMNIPPRMPGGPGFGGGFGGGGWGGGNMYAPSVPGGWGNPMFGGRPTPRQPGMGGGQGDPNRPVPAVMPPGWQSGGPPTPPGMGGGFGPQVPPGGGGMQGGFGDWAGLGKGFSEDQFMKARSFADRGKMGRAKQAIEQGGGQWSDQLHGLLGSPNGRWGNMGWNTMY